jgi:hypothetical protein
MKTTLRKIVLAISSKAVDLLETAVPEGAYRFEYARLLENAFAAYQTYIGQHNKLVRKYGYKDENRVVVDHPKNTPENIDAFNEAIEGMLDAEVELHHSPVSFAKIDPEAQKLLKIGVIRQLGDLIVPE